MYYRLRQREARRPFSEARAGLIRVRLFLVGDGFHTCFGSQVAKPRAV